MINSVMVIVKANSVCYDFYTVIADDEQEAQSLAMLKYQDVEEIGKGMLFNPEEKPVIEFDENGVSQLFTFVLGPSNDQNS